MQQVEKIKDFLLSKVKSKVGNENLQSVSHSQSLIEQGVFDSIDFITLLMELENKFGIEPDFDEVDPAKFTSINGLIALLPADELVDG